MRAPTILFVLALAALTPALSTQVTATATVRVACVNPAPVGSLVSIPLTPTTFTMDAKNVVVMEMESQMATGGWVEETLLSGFAGDSYFRWDGPNLFGQPGVGKLPFRFRVNNADNYLVRIHSRHDDPDPSEENDVWARVDNGPWQKLFHNTGSSGVGVWTFNARYESTGLFPEHFLNAGIHTFELSGRSKNFKIDRIHILPKMLWFAQLSDPESDLERHRPVIGQTMRVAIGDPTNSAGLTPGTAMTWWFGGAASPNHPCGITTRLGQALLGLSPAPALAGPPVVWMGPGNPAIHTASIVNDVSAVGTPFITQGVIAQPGKVILSDALDLWIGDN